MRVVGFNERSTQAMVVEHEEYIAIAFRGTDEPADWLDNLNAFRTQVLVGSIVASIRQSSMFGQEFKSQLRQSRMKSVGPCGWRATAWVAH